MSALWKELTQLLGTTQCRTTAYHPCANGLVERLHCQLKASLNALHNTSKWADALSMVLLGIRTAVKDDFKCTSAELVYGTTLRLHGEFVTPQNSSSLPDPVSYMLCNSKTQCQDSAQPTRQQRPRQVFVQTNLSSASYAFICHDAIC